ncbi:hypothetical protein GWK08_05980 [Leptobacterium flavescens]|uniref:Uncharacterized protein n=1 Tax=Leptobacterium flavescens TaxID=472055 RepID=A0A6P0UMA6_9FLAO|nr:hypothetical protein [Leptobacterium flavescens]NER12979.1 hypothetical protein [Leptobacterium flavescens]
MNYASLIFGVLLVIFGASIFSYELKKFKKIEKPGMLLPNFLKMFISLVALAILGLWIIIEELSKIL